MYHQILLPNISNSMRVLSSNDLSKRLNLYLSLSPVLIIYVASILHSSFSLINLHHKCKSVQELTLKTPN